MLLNDHEAILFNPATLHSNCLWPETDTAVVWHFDLSGFAETQEILMTLLTSGEQERARTFATETLRRRFIVGRGLLRSLLAAYYRTDPKELHLSYGPYGKPELDTNRYRPCLAFNLAHSEDQALLAIASSGQIGVDLEIKRPLRDLDGLVAQVCSDIELKHLHRLSETEKETAFYRLWVRKEALLKASGLGLQIDPRVCELTAEGDIATLPEALQAFRSYRIHDGIMEPTIASAVVLAPEVGKIIAMRLS